MECVYYEREEIKYRRLPEVSKHKMAMECWLFANKARIRNACNNRSDNNNK